MHGSRYAVSKAPDCAAAVLNVTDRKEIANVNRLQDDWRDLLTLRLFDGVAAIAQ